MKGAHVAGDVAREALDALVQQFSDRSAFVRELIQNSLDAGSGRIDVRLFVENKYLIVEVVDDGDGMDRRIIEDCLLTLFRSSKEHDLTKIGKFGVGFVSLFSIAPSGVWVDTARDGIHHQVHFHADRTYSLFQLDTPFEGTTVRIVTPFVAGGPATTMAQDIVRAVEYWCRFAHAEIWLDICVDGPLDGLREVQGSFAISGPVVVNVEEPGFRLSIAPSGAIASRVGFYNRGLTLREAVEEALPGLTFRVESSLLEHTITRDNVLRDAHFASVLARVLAIATERLVPEWRARLVEATEAQDHPTRRALLALSWPGLFVPPETLPCFQVLPFQTASLQDLRPWLSRLRSVRLREGHPDDPIALALAERGERVLAHSVQHPDADAASRLLHAQREAVAQDWVLTVRKSPRPMVAEAARLLRASGEARVDAVDEVTLFPADHPQRDKLFWDAPPWGLRRRSSPIAGKTTVCIPDNHPLFAQLANIPVQIAGVLLARVMLATISGRSDVGEWPMDWTAVLARPSEETPE